MERNDEILFFDDISWMVFGVVKGYRYARLISHATTLYCVQLRGLL